MYDLSKACVGYSNPAYSTANKRPQYTSVTGEKLSTESVPPRKVVESCRAVESSYRVRISGIQTEILNKYCVRSDP